MDCPECEMSQEANRISILSKYIYKKKTSLFSNIISNNMQ